MTTRKFLYVDTNGDYYESAGAYETADFISTSAGAGDAGKPIVLDAGGHIDASMINDADIDHGNLTGLGDDDHTQYILADGTRAFSGDQSMGGNKITNLANGTANSDAVNYGQLLAVQNGFDWKASVRVATTANINLSSAPSSIDGVTLSSGDRVLVKDQTTGADNGIYVFNGAASAMTRATDADSSAEVTAGLTVSVGEGTANADRIYLLETNDPITLGTTALSFVKIVVNTLIGGAGISFSGETISTDLLSGGGLKHVGSGDAAQLAVEPNDFAGDGLVDDGSDNLAIDWATAATDNKAVKASDLSSTSNGYGASWVGVEDAGNYFSSTTVEGALAELAAASGQVLYTVGTGGVSKGDLVYISGNDTVRKLAISTNNYGIGLALSTQSSGGSVVLQMSDYVLTGVLSGATAGTKYYWNGTSLTSTIPSGSGDYVWKVGFAKNATDLAVDVEFVKKNV